MGYGQLANYITEKTRIDDKIKYTEKERNEIETKKIRQTFNNRLIIVDEVHNIRLTDENNNKKAAVLLMKVAKQAQNLRLLFLSATPMYNSYKEIIWLTNLLNLNDRRSTIELSDVFDKQGEFKENGRALLTRKLTGYVSYVRGANPYTFPYRIYPELFSPKHTFGGKNTTLAYPTIQMNGKPIDEPLKHIHVYVNISGDYQKKAYSLVIENLRKKSFNSYNVYGEMREMPSFENMESFGYTLLQAPLEVLNIVYPNPGLDALINAENVGDSAPDDIKEESNIISGSIGSHGLENIMKWETVTKPMPMRIQFEYKNSVLKKYGRIFEEEHLHQYSAKIANICQSIRKSTGIVLIYSQYIDGGAVPIALALEEMGITRYCSHPQHNKPLFKKNSVAPLDARTMKPGEKGSDFSPAKYIMITGDKAFSPTNAEDIKYATNTNNRYGEKVKVVIISKAGSEGLDFKNIRQIHILEPWYNMNRIEQIIGRGVRNLSHCALPFEERNVEIYLHGTLLEKDDEEAADLYVYRLAEKKAKQIGKITRILKETSVDCILNIAQTNFTVDKLLEVAENQQIQQKLSSGKTIDYRVGDQPFTDICDYMDTCEYTCSPSANVSRENLVEDTYNIDYVKMNNQQIVEKIRNLFKENVFYERNVLIDAINIHKPYPIEHIFYALTYLIKNKNEYLVDRYNRLGNLVNKGNYYMFQPIEITDENISVYERTAPVDFKREGVVLEIPKEIQHVDAETDAEERADVLPQESSRSYENIVQTITQKFELALSKERVTIETGEKNWYKHATRVIQHLQDVYQIPLDKIKIYVLEHIMDMLLLPDKLTLLSRIYRADDSEFSPIEIEIRKYFNKRAMTQGDRKAVVLNKENSWKIFIQASPDTSSGSEWTEGEPEDYKIFEKQLDKFDVDDNTINDLVGFINMFKMKEMVFKIKDVRQARNNTGARCGDSTTKSDAIKLANILLQSNVYDNKTEFLLFGLCVIIEVLMRYFTEIKKDGKVYFLTPEETAINDIVHFNR
jgi:Helicase conserved C-terminal domain